MKLYAREEDSFCKESILEKEWGIQCVLIYDTYIEVWGPATKSSIFYIPFVFDNKKVEINPELI